MDHWHNLSLEQKRHIRWAFIEAERMGREGAFHYLRGWFEGWMGEPLSTCSEEDKHETR